MSPKVSSSADHTLTSRQLLNTYRKGFYEACESYGRSLHDIVDGMLGLPNAVCCPAHLSLEVEVGHGAIYKALSRGKIDTTALRALNLQVWKDLNLPPIFTFDCTAVPRPNSPTSPELTMQHLPDKEHRRVQPGWCYQTVCAQTPGHNSWNLVVDSRRLAVAAAGSPGRTTKASSLDNKEELAVASITAIVEELGTHCTFVFDSGYSAVRLTYEVRRLSLDADVVVRLSTRQVLYEKAPPKTPGKRGKAFSYGDRFPLAGGTSRRDANSTFSFEDSAYGQVNVSVFNGLRQKITRHIYPWLPPASVDGKPVPIPHIFGSVLEVEVAKLPGSRSGGKLWLWTSKDMENCSEQEVQELVRAYFHRFDIEHMFRFFKQTLGLTRFKCQLPSTFDNWFQLVTACYNQLLIAREWVKDHRLPWEKVRTILTPGRVRRVIKRTVAGSWHPPQRGFKPKPGPGARIGATQRVRKKHPTIRKGGRAHLRKNSSVS